MQRNASTFVLILSPYSAVFRGNSPSSSSSQSRPVVRGPPRKRSEAPRRRGGVGPCLLQYWGLRDLDSAVDTIVFNSSAGVAGHLEVPTDIANGDVARRVRDHDILSNLRDLDPTGTVLDVN